jgi:general secretion pathway protein J
MTAPRRCANCAGCAGFTLIELLIAVTLLAVLALISWRGLDALLLTRERLEPQADELRTLVAGFGQMETDFAQALDPQFVTLGGFSVSGIDGPGGALRIIRAAPNEPGQALTVQSVLYTVRDGYLMREVSTPRRTAAALAQAPVESVPLLAHVAALRLRVWKNGAWVEGAAALATADMVTQLPAGVEVNVQRADGATLRKVLVTR